MRGPGNPGGVRPLGPCAAGLTFGTPVALSRCVTNVHNALVFRHLAPPKHRCLKNFENFLVTKLLTHFKAHYFEASLANQQGEWRVGKGINKLRKIDESVTVDFLRLTEANSFGKFEVHGRVALPTKARLIQGNKNEITAYHHAGEYRAMSKALSAPINVVVGGCECNFQYAGGMDHNALSDWITEAISSTSSQRLFDERDGANWDSTMQEPLLRAEIELYRALGLQAAPEFEKRATGVWGRIHVKGAGGDLQTIRYVTRWKRLSGDWNTSVGNTLLSMLVVLRTLSCLDPGLRPKMVWALFMGDDYLAVYDYHKRPDTKALLAELNFHDESMGITPVRALFEDPYKVTFISMGLWPTFDGKYQFVPQPAKQLVKLFWTTKRLRAGEIPDYQSALARAFWPVYWGFPMMMAFLKAHYTKPSTTWQPSDVAVDAQYWLTPLTKENRGVDWQRGFVYKYDLPFTATNFRMPVEAGAYRHPLIDEMLRIECLDPNERPSRLA